MSKGSVLVIAPHSDDECLGVGGTIAKLANSDIPVYILTVGTELPPLYDSLVSELVHSEALAAHNRLGVKESFFLNIPSVEIPQIPISVLNSGIQEIVDELQPKIVFIPFPDRHGDHRSTFDASMVATRPVRRGVSIRMVAMYEVISETYFTTPPAEPCFVPQWTVDITNTIEQKIDAYRCFESRITPYPGPRSPEALRALAQFRGSQSSFSFGESFQIARSVVDPTELFFI